MAELIVKYPDRASEHFQISRLRITIGRSARNDLCIPDPFASRVHAEVRSEGDEYFLQDLGSANGTLYNGSVVDAQITLTRGGRIQIGETEIIFNDSPFPLSSGATMITDNSQSIPEATIALSSADRTTSGLFEAIEGARTREDSAAAADTTHGSRDHLVVQPVLGQQAGARLLAARRLSALRAQQPAHVEHRAGHGMRGGVAARRLAGARAHVEPRTAAGLYQAGRDQPVVGLDHGGTADARFMRAAADGRQARSGTQCVGFDALRETRRELCGEPVILLGVERHIYERASRVVWDGNCTATVLVPIL